MTPVDPTILATLRNYAAARGCEDGPGEHRDEWHRTPHVTVEGYDGLEGHRSKPEKVETPAIWPDFQFAF